MKKLWIGSALWLHLAAFSQSSAPLPVPKPTTPSSATAPLLAPLRAPADQAVDRQALRSKIAEERARVEAQFNKDEAACYKRFAVSGCLLDLQKQRRLVLDKLRQQDNALNAAERQEKAQRQLQQIREKTAPEKMAEEAAKRAQAEKDFNERQEKAKQSTESVKPPQGRAVQSPKPAGRTSEQAAESELRFNRKLQDAQQRRERLPSPSEGSSGSAPKPLPAAP